MSAREGKEAEEELEKGEKQQEKVDAEGLIRGQAQAREDAENVQVKRAELLKLEKNARASASKAPVAP